MPRPRRSRFTCLVHKHGITPKQVVCLAYSAQGAVDYYRGCGYTVLNVTAGDLVNVPADGGWTLDRTAYREAVEFLGLKWPVTIKQTSRVGGQMGAHRLKPNGVRATHSITIKSYLTPKQAGETLWHELCHAMQSERVATDAGAETPAKILAAWRHTSERSGTYRNRPIEVEARSYEQYNNEIPLCRA